MSSFFICLIATILFSFVPERFVKPTPPHFSKNNFILQATLVSSAFILVSLLVQRPLFSALAVSIFLIIVSAVNNAKFKALREPLVFSDFAMFAQAFKHPRLYFPFLGFWPVVIMPLVIIGLIYALLKFEPAMPFTWQRMLLSLFAIMMLQWIAREIALRFTLAQQPEEDIQQIGLINSAFAYAIYAGSDGHKEHIENTLSKASLANFTIPKNSPKPNITLIQSESFFDARRLHENINSSVLKHYDECLADALQFGKFNVPAWGANTMRTEFTCLSGLRYEDLALYRFYPYQFLHKNHIPSLANVLQSQGYHTVCIHPHPASFFGRNRIFPKMGFDSFIDIQEFDKSATFGPYISDQAVTDKIKEISQAWANINSDKSLFIFAITMENHGPLHLEKTTVDEQKGYFSELPLKKANDLAVYLRHLKNADKQIADLMAFYEKSEKPSTLCLYGDHIPSMPNIYSDLNYQDDHSDYFIWQNNAKLKTSKNPEHVDLNADELANVLLKQLFKKTS